MSLGQWFGTIPQNWKYQKIKFLTTLRSEKINESLGFQYIGLENIESKTGNYLVTNNIQEVEGTSNKFYKEDVLFSKLRPYLAKCIIADVDGICTTELLVMKVKEGLLSNKYLKYLLLSPKLIDLVNSSTYGSKMPRANWEFIKNIEIPLPSFEAQKSIECYIETKTRAVDKLVEQIERLIKLLEEKRQSMITEAVTKGLNPNVKMKDSGVEWIGEIPENWYMKKLKYFIETIKGFAFKSEDFTESGIPVVKTTDIKNNTVINLSDTFVAEDKYEDFEKVRVFKDDILMSTVGSTPNVINSAVGQLGLVPIEFDGALLNQNAVKLKADNNIVFSKYLFYMLCNKRYREYLNLGAHGTANQASLSLDYILDFLAVLPPLVEQGEILKVLDYKTSQIDKVTNNMREQIEKLKEYRQSVIYEAVTGKIDVRNFELAD